MSTDVPMIGRRLGRYSIDSKLGEGGMGVVYKGHDTQLDRVVAVKVLPHDRVSDPARRQRFAQEARAASALNHPGIVTVHDICSESGIDFIVMEYVAGRTLEETIPAKGMRPVQALRLAVQIADALAQAHAAGIIHRDLKPSNVMVTDEGRVKILDFGVAKLLDAPDSSTDTVTRTSPLTEEGIVLGTAAYMSPEQAQGRRLDARSDIFSFGAVLYEMVTGRRPFDGDSRAAVHAKILDADPVPPSRLLASIPTDVEKTILRCLRKDPARRYQTMADLKVALEDLAADSAAGSLAQSPVARTPRRWRWGRAALVPILVTAGYLAWRMKLPTERVPPLSAVPLLSLPGGTRFPSFSPDGNQIAFTWTGPDSANPDIYVQQIGAGSPLRLTTDAGTDSGPMWSPDGRWIAFFRGPVGGAQEVRVVPPLGGAERKVIDIHPRGFMRLLSLAWCPDASCIVLTDSLGAARPDALFVVSLDSGEKRQLTSPEASVFADSNPDISPDGKWLVFRRETAPFNGELMLFALRADLTTVGEPRRLTAAALPAYNPRWTPDSREIVFSAKQALWRLRISGDGAPERLPFVGDDGVTPIVSRAQPDGRMRLAYVRSFTDPNIWRVDTTGPGIAAAAPPTLAIASNRRDIIPHCSPDSRRVTFVSTRSGESEIWVADANGANAIQLTSMSATPGWPRWSPDGRTIAFHSNPDGNADIFVVPAEGGRPRNLTSHPAVDTFASFSRDGRWVYFTSSRSGPHSTVWKVPADGGAAVQVGSAAGAWALESPQGTDVYYIESSSSTSPGTLWRIPVKGGAATRILERVNGALFDAIDSGVYYIEAAGSDNRLRYFDLAARKSTAITGNLGVVEFGLSACPNGRTIFFSRVDSWLNDLMLVENFR